MDSIALEMALILRPPDGDAVYVHAAPHGEYGVRFHVSTFIGGQVEESLGEFKSEPHAKAFAGMLAGDLNCPILGID